MAAGWGAAAGCAVGAPYVAVGWLGSAKLWPKAVRSCPYPEEDDRGDNRKDRGHRETRILMSGSPEGLREKP